MRAGLVCALLFVCFLAPVCSQGCSNSMAATSVHQGGAPAAALDDLDRELQGVDSNLASVIKAIATSCAEISEALRTTEFTRAGSTNSFGDDQLQVDLFTDEIIFRNLRACPAVASASSEEQADIIPLGGSGYSVAFDPLDGSSIFDANFAVGTIFGVWPGPSPLGQTGAAQVAAAYSVYGPRTLLVLARGDPAGNPGARVTQEFVLSPDGWTLRKVHVHIGSRSTVAPANLRAAGSGNAAYAALMDSWIAAGLTLRYSGGMVPDVHHLLAKGGGVFCSPASAAAPAKLRLLYECAPLAYVVEAAGGASSEGTRSILDVPINDTSARTVIALGSRQQVAQCSDALRNAAVPDS